MRKWDFFLVFALISAIIIVALIGLRTPEPEYYEVTTQFATYMSVGKPRMWDNNNVVDFVTPEGERIRLVAQSVRIKPIQ